MSPLSAAPKRPEALQILLDASSMLLAAENESHALAQILQLSSTLLLCDGFAVWREFDEGKTWRVITHQGLSGNYRFEMKAGGVVPDSIWAIEDVLSDERLKGAAETYRQEGISSMLVAPWKLGASISGTVVFYWRTHHRFQQSDFDYAAALTNLSASALNRLELQEQNRREKQRLSFLAEASALLASSLDYEDTLQRLAYLAVPEIADWCTVHVVEDGKISRLVVAHADPEMRAFTQQYAEKYPEKILPDFGLGKVLRTREPEIYLDITDAMLVQVARDEEHLGMIRRLGLKSSILMPLVTRGKVLGAIRLLSAGSNRRFTQDDLQLAEDLSRRAAAAIDNAQLHQEVLEQQSELRLSHAAARMGSWSWDLVRGRLFWSQEFRSLHGLAPGAEASLQAARELVHPEDRERVMREVSEILGGFGESISLDHRALTPDGRVLWMQVRGRIQRDTSGKSTRVAGLVIDVTDSRLAEQTLRRTEKLAAAGRLAATVAHEVNNPLEALVNLVYLAQRVDGLPEEAAAHLRIADEELGRIAHIVTQTLGFYRETASPRSTALSELVSSVLGLYRSRAASRAVQLVDETARGAGLKVMVNAGEIKQVVANLVSNAIDATPEGGSVTLSLGESAGQVEVVVSDTGSGISKESRKRLFEPFFTTKLDVGTGLGLWVSKGIIEKHGGSIVVDDASEDGIGTIMRIVLPQV